MCWISRLDAYADSCGNMDGAGNRGAAVASCIVRSGATMNIASELAPIGCRNHSCRRARRKAAGAPPVCIALVPTRAICAGHTSSSAAGARGTRDREVFVNPLQLGQPRIFAAYPRTLMTISARSMKAAVIFVCAVSSNSTRMAVHSPRSLRCAVFHRNCAGSFGRATSMGLRPWSRNCSTS